MYTYSKSLTQADFDTFSEHALIEPFLKKIHPNYRYEHPMRKWEYGLALKFLLEVGSKTVLDVGGGGSALAPILHHYGMKVTQVDPDPSGIETVAKQNEILGSDIEFINEDFLKYNRRTKYDAVICMSTIEHIETKEDEKNFMTKLCKPGNFLFLTTDFSKTGKTFSGDHYRTYNKVSMAKLANLAKKFGFKYYGGVDWEYGEPMVYDYTFASLALYK
jgi:2-polyprenyl-3-methyl-5-hydroxy-6-metoxy-1,4-benzoquinol methylase